MIAAKLPKEITRLKSLGVDVTETNIEIIVNLHAFFQNYQKIKLWLTTKNLNFGNITPLRLMQMGRSHKVLEFIINAIDENESLTQVGRLKKNRGKQR